MKNRPDLLSGIQACAKHAVRLWNDQRMEPAAGKVPVSVLSALQPILWAGIICGVLDGLSAVGLTVLSGSTPVRLFQYIASGLVGRSAFTGGLVSSALGVSLHFTVALGAAAVYYAASRRAPFLNEHAILAGALFGVAVHVFMTFVVVPLSAIGTRRFVWSGFLVLLVIHIIVVGPSIALTVRHFARLER
jgi:hypothetical protein